MTTRDYQFIVGPETSTLPTAGTPTLDTDFMTKGYADDHYVQGQAAVADLAALKAIISADRVDRNQIYVDAMNATFAFDSASSASGDDWFIVAPSSGTGRWIRIGSQSAASATNILTVPKDTKANLDILSRKEGALLYASDEDTLYVDDGTQLKETGGGGSGGINYIDNPDFESSITGWSHYDDGAVAVPVNGTGEAGATDLAIARNATTPLRGTGDLKATASANAIGEGFSYDFSIDNVDASKRLAISFDWKTDASYVSNDVGVYIYDVTGAALIYPSTVNLPATTTPTTINVFFNATTSTSYRLIFHTQGTTAAWNAYVDNVQVGPQDVVQTVPVGDIDVSGITFTSLTPASSKISGTRIGNKLFVQGTVTLSGAPTTTPFTLNLPAGITIDTTKYKSSVGDTVGILHAYKNSAANLFSSVAVSNVLFYDGSTNNKLYATYSTSSYGLVSKNGDDFLVSGSNFSFNFDIYIAEWAGGSVNVSNSQVEYYSTAGTWDDNSSTMAYGPAGTTMGGALSTTRNKTITTLTPIQSTDRIALEINTGGYGFVDAGNKYPDGGTFGASISVTGTNTIVVQFRRYSDGTSDWVNTYKWRVSKSSNPLSIGQIVTPTSQIYINNSTGYGSSATMIRLWTSANEVKVGTDITYTSDGTNGDKFTINRTGIYSIIYVDNKNSGAAYLGLSVNSNQLTTSITSITASHRIAVNQTISGGIGEVNACLRLNAGDVVRCHTDSGVDGGGAVYSYFRICQVAI